MGNVCGGGSARADAPAAAVPPAHSNDSVPDLPAPAPDVGSHKAGRASAEGSRHAASSIQQATKGRGGQAIAISVAPAPPPDDFPEIKAAVAEAQKEVKVGSKAKFESLYSLGKVIGTGAYARVQIVTCLKDGQKYAAKIIRKERDRDALMQQLQNIVKEVAIMRLLGDHPNCVQLHQVLQDASAFYLVMEYCNAGEIFDQIIKSGHMTEAVAAAKVQQLVSFLAHAHKKHVIHRDIKPENLLLVHPDGAPDGPEGLTLKVVDYGCSTFCVPGKRLCKKFGTPYYVAPEVLWRDYDKGADVWSAGVVLFILLCGRPPFGGRSDDEIIAKVRTGHYRMCPDDWAHVSEPGRDLVQQMLKLDATARPSAEEVLSHRWFTEAAAAAAAHERAAGELDNAAPASMGHVVARLEAFAGMSRMKRLALVVLCHTVTDKHLARLREAFGELDKDGDGHLNAAELHRALRATGALAKAGLAAEIPADALEGLIAASDLYGEGYVDVDEFLAAMVANSNYSKSRDALRASFDALDHDHDGFISSSDLQHLHKELLGDHHMTANLAEEMMSEVSSCIDESHHHHMNFDEFCSMMTGNDPSPGFSGRRLSAEIRRAEEGASAASHGSTPPLSLVASTE